MFSIVKVIILCYIFIILEAKIDKSIELAHLGIRVEHFGRGASFESEYRLIKVLDINNLEIPIKPELECARHNNVADPNKSAIEVMCTRLKNELDQYQAIFNDQNRSRNRRGLAGVGKLFGRLGSRLSRIRFRSGRVRNLKYKRFRNPGEQITNSASKSSKVKKIASGMLAAAAGSATYDLISSSTDKLTGAVVQEAEMQKTQASEVVGLVESDQQFLKINNLNNDKVEKWSQNMSNHVRLLYKNESVTRVFLELISDQQKVEQYLTQNLLIENQINRIKRITDLADTGYLSRELICEEELQATLDEVKVSLGLMHSYLVLNNIDDYYRIPIASVEYSENRTAVQIDVPISSKPINHYKQLLLVNKMPFRCPMNNCSGIVEFKLEDNLLILDSDSNLVATGQDSQWECTDNRKNRLCYSLQDKSSYSIDKCLESLLESEEFNYNCTIRKSDRRYTPIQLNNTAIYSTSVIDGVVKGKLILKSNPLDEKFEQFTFNKMNFNISELEQVKVSELSHTENRIATVELNNKLNKLEQQARINLDKIKLEFDNLKGWSGAELGDYSKLQKLVGKMHKYNWFSHLCSIVIMAILIRKRLLPNIGFVIINPHIISTSAENILTSPLVNATLSTAKQVAYNSLDEINPIHLIMAMLESAIEWFIDWCMVISMCSICAIIIYQILFRVVHIYTYKGIDLTNLNQAPNNAILSFEVRESNLFSEKFHSVQLNTYIKLEGTEDRVVINKAYISYMGGQIRMLTPISIHSYSYTRDVFTSIDMSKVRWRRGYEFNQYRAIRVIECTISLIRHSNNQITDF